MKKKRFGIVTVIVLAQITIMALVFLLVYFFMDTSLTRNIETSVIQKMETVSEERALIIENYVSEAENYLTAYSRSGDITNLLLHPQDAECVERAQKYTETFSADRAYLEGIYASEWNTHVLAHTNANVVGITTREGDSLKQLQDAMLQADGVYNTGIIISPASKQQIISIYRACFDENNNPIGLVGGGIYTEGLVDTLDSLPTKGMEQLRYYLVNVNTGEYIFNADTEKINTLAEDEYIQTIAEKLRSNPEETVSSLSYIQNGEEYLAAYSYMADKGWVFIITDPASEVFSFLTAVRIALVVICVLGILIMMIFTYILISFLIKPVKVSEHVLDKVKDGDISEQPGIYQYTHRRDELGSIAQATGAVIHSLREIVCTLTECCCSLGEKTGELDQYANELVDNMTDNTGAIEELSVSLKNTNRIVEDIHDKEKEIEEWVDETLQNLKKSMGTGDTLISSSHEMCGQAEKAYEKSRKTFEQTREAVKDVLVKLQNISQINSMTEHILSIASKTNLLSLNASIEAARAGEAGKGFAVVAGEIGKLAETSTQTASNIQQVCYNANESVAEVEECFNEIMKFMEEMVMEEFKQFAEKADEYSVAVDGIRQDIMNLDSTINALNRSMEQISDSVDSVKNIAGENQAAIDIVVGKNETTMQVAGEIRMQSDNNKKLIRSLENIIRGFHMDDQGR